MVSSGKSAACASGVDIGVDGSGPFRDTPLPFRAPMEPLPKVGNVVITTAKGMKWLPGLLPSIASQTYADQETSVVVDGADPAVLDYLSTEWPDVEIVPIPDAGGFARAIDRGVRSSPAADI